MMSEIVLAYILCLMARHLGLKPYASSASWLDEVLRQVRGLFLDVLDIRILCDLDPMVGDLRAVQEADACASAPSNATAICMHMV